MKIQSLLFSALALLPLAGCLDQEDLDDEAELADAVDLENLPAYNCAIPSTPSTPDESAVLAQGDSETFYLSGYGNQECSPVTVGYEWVTDIKAKIKYGTYLPTFTEASCEDTRISAVFYRRSGSTWTRLPTVSKNGSWTGFNCLLPKVELALGMVWRDAPPPINKILVPDVAEEIRVAVYARRGATGYGAPVEVTGAWD